jgi:hypothetical protein
MVYVFVFLIAGGRIGAMRSRIAPYLLAENTARLDTLTLNSVPEDRQ